MNTQAQFGTDLDRLPPWTEADEKVYQHMVLRKRAHDADKGRELRRVIFETMGGFSVAQSDRLYRSLIQHAGRFSQALKPFVSE